MNNYREFMREAVSSPYDGSDLKYGDWGILRPIQRTMILRLLDEMDSSDTYIKYLFDKRNRLENKIYKAIELEEELMYLANKLQ